MEQVLSDRWKQLGREEVDDPDPFGREVPGQIAAAAWVDDEAVPLHDAAVVWGVPPVEEDPELWGRWVAGRPGVVDPDEAWDVVHTPSVEQLFDRLES